MESPAFSIHPAHLSRSGSTAAAGRQQTGELWSSLADVCALIGLPQPLEIDDVELFQHLRFHAGQRVYRAGSHFDTLYAVHSGWLKTVLTDDSGEEQVLSFPMRGDVIGVDGIHAGTHVAEVVALSECDLVAINFKRLAALGQRYRGLEYAVYQIVSAELVREQNLIETLRLSAEAKVARFLIALVERSQDNEMPANTFILKMSREEIGSYLDLSLETVSRTMSAMNAAGYIHVQRRAIVVLDLEALKRMRSLPPFHARAKADCLGFVSEMRKAY
jgi:CRP/FNR family transcriptional regulator, anaerobic regulatory protein